MKILKLIVGVLLIAAAVDGAMGLAYFAASSASPTGFSQLMAYVVGTPLFVGLGAWLITSARKPQ
jgi:uncharacterized integral membrane protein